MTEFIKGVSTKLLESSLVALLLAVGIYFLYGETKLERAARQKEQVERIADLKLSHATEMSRAVTLQAVVEQNSVHLKNVAMLHEKSAEKLDKLTEEVRRSVINLKTTGDTITRSNYHE